MPIKGLTEQRRLPRLGKIRLGVKKKNQKGVEYPSSTDYFVCPPEVQVVYGDKPKRLDVIIPVEDDEIWANQYYRQYSRARGLVCKGDGVTCRRMLDTDTGVIAGKDTKSVVWQEGLECKGRECPDYQGRACQEVMNLQFMLPKVPGLGVWQIDTGSIHSIMNINNCAEMIRAMVGRVSWVPLVLSLEPTEVVNPEDGRKKTVYCMSLKYEGNAEQLLIASEKPRLQLLLNRPSDDEAPDDREISRYTPEKVVEAEAYTDDLVEDSWGNGSKSVVVAPQDVKEGPASPIDLDWLKEQMKYLQSKKLALWSNANTLKKLNGITGKTAKTISEAVNNLSLAQAEALVKEINELVEIA